MAFARQTPGGKGLIRCGIEGDGAGRQEDGVLLTGEASVPGEIQAKFDAAGVKAARPIARVVTGEVVPFDADAVLAITAVQALPAAAEGE